MSLIKMIKVHGLSNSEMVIQPNNEDMVAKGMVLYINRNTKTTNGYYYVDVTKDEDEGKPHDNKRYPVKMVDHKIHSNKRNKVKNKKRNRKL
ncbi:Csa1 family protein [Staphylococcus aureus]